MVGARVIKFEGKKPLGKLRCKRWDNIKQMLMRHVGSAWKEINLAHKPKTVICKQQANVQIP
jgi:hypothetical protein